MFLCLDDVFVLVEIFLSSFPTITFSFVFFLSPFTGDSKQDGSSNGSTSFPSPQFPNRPFRPTARRSTQDSFSREEGAGSPCPLRRW